MTQKEFIHLLHEKYNITINGYSKDSLDVTFNPTKNSKVFLLPYKTKETVFNFHTDKDGKEFTIATNIYLVENKETGEKQRLYINKGDSLLTKIYNRDLIILDMKNKYNEKLFNESILKEYEQTLPKRIRLFYRVDTKTILDDTKGFRK